MSSLRFHAKRLFDGYSFLDDQVLTITDGMISAIDENINEVDVAVSGLVVPGYIDLQINGGGGMQFNHTPTPECLHTMFNAHAATGTSAAL